MKKQNFLLVILFFGLLSVNLISAGISEVGVVYSDRVLDQFDKLDVNKTFVDVIIYPKNSLDKEKIILDLSEENIGRIVSRDISEFFSVEITEETFFELLKDERIDKISYNAPIRGIDGSWQNKSLKISLTLCIVLIFLIILSIIHKRKKGK